MPYQLRKPNERKQNPYHPMVDKSLYLPYVDDNESIEEIMKKFEMVEKIQKKKAESLKCASVTSGDSGAESKPINEEELELDDDEMRELTDRFGTVADENDNDDDEMYEIDENDEDDDDYSEYEYSESSRKGKSHSSGSIHVHYSKSKRFVDVISSKAVSRKCYRIVKSESGEYSLVYIGHTPAPYPYEYIKIPPAIPLTWTHVVQGYEPQPPDTCIYTEDPMTFDYLSLDKFYNAIFINTPTNYDCTTFKKLVFPKKLIPTGFIFIWADKENIPMIINIFECKNFFYVENLVWVQAHDEDSIAMNDTTPSLLRRSKRTLLILRRGRRQGNGNISFDPIDMRHQRNPDVVIAPYSTQNGSLMQRTIYNTIETLVPRCDAGGLHNSNDYLQIFGNKGEARKNWTIVLKREDYSCLLN